MLKTVSGISRAASARNPLPNKRPLLRPSTPELILWLVFAAVTFLTVWVHEPWRDEAQGFLIARDNTLAGLIGHMKDESQFLLWFLFTWPFVRLAEMPIFGVNILHWMLSCTTAFLILRRAPFRLLTRAGLIFSVVFAFEYTAVARHYALGLFLLTVLLIHWKDRFRHPIWFACGIGLCASTNLPVWACLAAICTTLGFEIIRDRRWTRGNLCAILIAACGFVLALAEIYNFHGGFGSQYVSRSGDFFWEAPWERTVYACRSISRLVFLPLPLCLIVFMTACLYFARKRSSALVCFLTNTAVMFILQLVGGFHSMRHIGFLLAGTVMTCWITAVEEEETPPGLPNAAKIPPVTRFDRAVGYAAGAGAAAILIMQVVMWPFFVWNEVAYSFSHGRDTARFIRENLPPDIQLYCFTARANTTVMAYLPGREFFILDRHEYGTFSKWGRVQPGDMKALALEVADRLPEGRNFAAFVVAVNEDPHRIPPNMLPLYDSRKKSPAIWSPYSESYLVFAVTRPETVNWDGL